MGRHTDPQWKYVEKLDNNRFKCKFCKVTYSGGASRIKYHLSSLEGNGIKICPKVPRDVRRKVNREIEGSSSSRKRKALSSSSDDEDNYTDSTSSQHQNDEVRTQARDGEDGSPMHGHVHNQDQQAEEGNDMDNNIGESMQSVETGGIELLTTKLVGEAFERNIDKIWAWLVNDDVSSIGIYGMAGVGKTELVKHINNKLLKDSNPFYHVHWFDVSRNFTPYELQNAIAKKVGLHLSNEIGENERAAKLSKALRNGKHVLILDGVWKDIDLQKVGIPVSENGCKLILTTQSFDVCRVIASQKTIKVECLDDGEDWDLFEEILGGYQTTLSHEVGLIATSVVEECERLPLAIVTMARRMRGVVDVYQWRNALYKLERLTIMQDNMDVFQKLKLGYDHLDNSAMQQCFLYCASFPNYIADFDREKLIEYLIVEGIIERKSSRQQEIDEGHSILNTLENVCLLEKIDEGVKMHKWIRKMALQIQIPFVMVETGLELTKFPDEKRWTENLLRILAFNILSDIHFNFSPCCPNLSTLLLEKLSLKLIPDSFFEKLSGLKVLSFSHTNVETLPGSLFNIVGLVALFLSDCRQLRHVPSLAKLRELEKLDMSDSGVEEVPEGMELLSKLRYLDLSGTNLKEFPTAILPNLLHLQFLKIDLSVSLLVVELECLKELEILQCGLDKDGLLQPDKRNILIGLQELKLRNWPIHDVGLHYKISSLFLKKINIYGCSSIKNLFTPLLVSHLKNLGEIKLTNCSQMEEIIAAAEHEEEVTEDDAIANVEITLPKLRTLCLCNLKELKSISKGKIVCDSINYVTVINCTKLNRLPLSVSPIERLSFSLSCSQSSPLPLLKEIKVWPREWWESLEWDDSNAKNVVEHKVRFSFI